MGRRSLALIGAAASMAAVTMLVTMAPIPVTGQTSTPPAQSGAAASTSWGDPDVQGIRTNDYETPLQRSPRHPNKQFFTDGERAEQDGGHQPFNEWMRERHVTPSLDCFSWQSQSRLPCQCRQERSTKGSTPRRT
jgi:hypothetical protein